MVSDDSRNALPMPLKNPNLFFPSSFLLSQSQNSMEINTRMVVKNNTGLNKLDEKTSFKKVIHA